MNVINTFLNRFTMYRLVIYVLGIYVCLSLIFAFTGRLSDSPTDLVLSLGLILVPAYGVDRILGRKFNTPANMESALITSLILFFVVQPADSVMTGVALIVAGAVSSASKFLLSWNGKHVFNPAAFGAALLSLTGLQAATWWIGSSIFWPFTAFFGLVVMYKVRRIPLVIAFGIIAVPLQALLFLHGHQDLGTSMKQAMFASPIIFLASIMLTEPATMPPRRSLQLLFGVIVAIFYVGGWKIGPLIIYPEVALLLGNIFAFIVSPKFKVRLELQEIHKISDRVYDYVFKPEQRFNFSPGQYMEWTLANVPYDSRGNRRTFTIASSPTEREVHVGLKYYEPASMFKATFEQLKLGDSVYGSQLAGNFTLKGKEGKKIAFVAGGIGITPFRSMIKYVTDKNVAVDIVLLYMVANPEEFAYTQELEEAKKVGVKTVFIITDDGYQSPGAINTKLRLETVKKLVPDYDERIFYVSGPNTMVDGTKSILLNLGVSHMNIKTDHFSGY